MLSVQHFREGDAHPWFAVENLEARRDLVSIRVRGVLQLDGRQLCERLLELWPPPLELSIGADADLNVQQQRRKKVAVCEHIRIIVRAVRVVGSKEVVVTGRSSTTLSTAVATPIDFDPTTTMGSVSRLARRRQEVPPRTAGRPYRQRPRISPASPNAV